MLSPPPSSWLLLFLLAAGAAGAAAGESANGLTGHLRPLGQQRPSQGGVIEWNCDRVNTPQGAVCMPSLEELNAVTNMHNPDSARPVLLKGACNHWPAKVKWTDEYLLHTLGSGRRVQVEEDKKETRERSSAVPLHLFLEQYVSQDKYFLVDRVSQLLWSDLCLSADWFSRLTELERPMMWLSSGGTRSVLHRDPSHNINCLVEGNKHWVLMNASVAELVYNSHDHGGYGERSLIDVDSVDLVRFPTLTQAMWWEADMQPGDCLYVPTGWFHHVKSGAGRNLAVNIWFEARFESAFRFDDTVQPSDCVALNHPEIVFRTYQPPPVMWDMVVDMTWWFVASGLIPGAAVGVVVKRHYSGGTGTGTGTDISLGHLCLVLCCLTWFAMELADAWPFLQHTFLPHLTMLGGFGVGLHVAPPPHRDMH